MPEPGPELSYPGGPDPRTGFCGCVECLPVTDPDTGKEIPTKRCHDCPPPGIAFEFRLPPHCFESSLVDPASVPGQDAEHPNLCYGFSYYIYEGSTNCTPVDDGC